MIEFYNNNNNNNNNYEKMVQDTSFLQSTHPCNGRTGRCQLASTCLWPTWRRYFGQEIQICGCAV